MASKGKLVTAKEVLAAGVQPGPVMETAIITLAHLAFISEKVELEVLYLALITCFLCIFSKEVSFFHLSLLMSQQYLFSSLFY